MIYKTVWAFAVFFVLLSCSPKTNQPESQESQNTKQVLLIGTFHYNNPGADVAQTKSFDILSESAQAELEEISEKIKEYKPDQVLVEWPYNEQQELDSLYQLYLADNYFTNDNLSSYYQKSETFQLAFRVAKKAGLPSVKAVDYRNTDFPFDSLMTVTAQQNQTTLQKKFTEGIERFTQEFDEKIESGASLLDMTYYLNTEELRQFSNEFHTQVPLLVGDRDNFVGAYLASEWYRRNLYMWALAQKATQPNDKRIMLLLGSSHVAMIKNFIDKNPDWDTVELEKIMQ
ncbi:DUF5694 domain-containing protein [Flagellimonas iocasae]|uniref:DUF5694 domain-containing protein n=1 Tax=Flagellimonas iocasae TaxID=2055905 RepID=A0ABW4XYJ8_9FLAO